MDASGTSHNEGASVQIFNTVDETHEALVKHFGLPKRNIEKFFTYLLEVSFYSNFGDQAEGDDEEDEEDEKELESDEDEDEEEGMQPEN